MWLVISLKFHFSWKLIHDSFVIKYSAKREREKNWKIWKLIRKIFFQRDKGIIGGARGRGNKRVDTKMERHEFPSLLWSVKRESLFWRRVGTSGSRPRVSTTENSTSFSNPEFLSRFEQKTVIIREWGCNFRGTNATNRWQFVNFLHHSFIANGGWNNDNFGWRNDSGKFFLLVKMFKRKRRKL